MYSTGFVLIPIVLVTKARADAELCFVHFNNLALVVELTSNEMMDQKLDYIHMNPVKAGFVDEPESYLYSSARDYAGRKGFIRYKIY